MAFERKYSDEVRTASVEEALRRRRAEPGNRAIIREVAEEYSVGYQSLRQWLARFDDGSYDFDDDSDPADGRDPELSRDELLAQIARLEQRIDVLEADNRSLTRVVAMFADQLRPTTTA
ncbi:transposase [Leucobacter musarum]|uniref:transposase n=1 Tax=Leucobacter musarum TaxID=1930747 RepID=UPI0006A7D66B|nr:transposase [Leucobacter musarum]